MRKQRWGQNNLKSRVTAYEDEGAQIVSRVWE
jgi:hypothetical protein